MIKLSNSKKIGKIYQLPRKTKFLEIPGSILIQTYGIPRPDAIKCTNRYELIKILNKYTEKCIQIFCISSLGVDEKLNAALRKAVCRNCKIYLSTFETFKIWYTDLIIN